MPTVTNWTHGSANAFGYFRGMIGAWFGYGMSRDLRLLRLATNCILQRLDKS